MRGLAAAMLGAFVGWVLVAAALLKLMEGRDALAMAIRKYELVPVEHVRAAAAVLPPLEMALGVGLIVGVSISMAASFSSALFAAFAVAIAVNLKRGRADIPCGCFGVATSHRLSWGLVIRSGALAVLSMIIGLLAITGTDRSLLIGASFQGLTPADRVLAGAAGGAVLATLSLCRSILRLWASFVSEKRYSHRYVAAGDTPVETISGAIVLADQRRPR